MKRNKSKKFAVIFAVLSYIIIAMSFLLLVISLVPRFMHMSGFAVLSESMEPTIKKGRLVFAEKVEFEDIKVNDVLVFFDKDGNTGFTHRVTAIDTEHQYLSTKGDANNIGDKEPTSFEYVAGRVKNAVPLLGYITILTHSTKARIIIAVIYIIWIAAFIENVAGKRRVRKSEDI